MLVSGRILLYQLSKIVVCISLWLCSKMLLYPALRCICLYICCTLFMYFKCRWKCFLRNICDVVTMVSVTWLLSVIVAKRTSAILHNPGGSYVTAEISTKVSPSFGRETRRLPPFYKEASCVATDPSVVLCNTMLAVLMAGGNE